jgi:hypothetical protein
MPEKKLMAEEKPPEPVEEAPVEEAPAPTPEPPAARKREGLQPYKKRGLDSRSVARRMRHQNR